MVMSHFSKAGQYAIRAMIHIQHHAPCSKESIAEKQHIPKFYLSKILKRLKDENLLRYHAGTDGGYFVGPSPAEISLYDILSVFENVEDTLNACAIHSRCCKQQEPCPLHVFHASIRNQVRQFLVSNHLSQIKLSPPLHAIRAPHIHSALSD